MAEENQATAKDPKKVEADRWLAEYNRRKREELKVQKSEVLTSSTCYGIQAVLAVGVIGSLGEVNAIPNNRPPQQPHPQTNKFEME